jgi:hypothetical protein
MIRLFFDIVGPKTRSIDFHGRYFSNPSDAHEDAKILSMDLSCTDKLDWRDAEVQVKDASGRQLFSVPIIELAEVSHAA